MPEDRPTDRPNSERNGGIERLWRRPEDTRRILVCHHTGTNNVHLILLLPQIHFVHLTIRPSFRPCSRSRCISCLILILMRSIRRCVQLTMTILPTLMLMLLAIVMLVMLLPLLLPHFIWSTFWTFTWHSLRHTHKYAACIHLSVHLLQHITCYGIHIHIPWQTQLHLPVKCNVIAWRWCYEKI